MRALRCFIRLLILGLLAPSAWAQAECKKPVYLTFDTGHMEVAPLIAQVLAQHRAKATFFAANEPTKVGDGSLGTHWTPWWRERAQEGHSFASHTLDHTYWRADMPGTGQGVRFKTQPTAGAQAGQMQVLTAQQYCQQIQASAQRLAVRMASGVSARMPAPWRRSSS